MPVLGKVLFIQHKPCQLRQAGARSAFGQDRLITLARGQSRLACGACLGLCFADSFSLSIMKITRDMHDIVGGLLMTAAGLFFAFYGSRYPIGDAARMGPGYFPVVLGWVLAVLGLLVALPAFWRRGSAIAVDWKSLLWSVLSLLVFAATLLHLGVALSSLVSAMVALMPSQLGWRSRLIVSAVVALLTTLIFPIGLQMLLPIWPALF